MTDKTRALPAYRQVSDQLRQRIVGGELRAGDALPIEADLSVQFAVHRSTVREALRQLEQEGLVQRSGKKLLVTLPQPGELAQAAQRALRQQQVTFREVWEVASTLEPLCARLAAERISSEQLQRLQDNLAQTQALVDAGQSPVQVTIAFQAIVAEAAHNQALLLARAPVSLLMLSGYAAIAPTLPQSGARLLEAHRQVYESLRQGDAGAATEAARVHVAVQGERFTDLLASLPKVEPATG